MRAWITSSSKKCCKAGVLRFDLSKIEGYCYKKGMNFRGSLLRGNIANTYVLSQLSQ